MNDLAIIPFRAPDLVDYTGRGRPNNFRLSRPTPRDQSRRLSGRFRGLDARLDSPAGLAELRRDPGSIAPERAIVFELKAGVDAEAVYRALRNIPDFELLGEEEDARPPANGFAQLDKKGNPTEKALKHRMYFAMPSVDGLKSLLSLWRRYEREEPFGQRYTPKQTAWRDVFDNLDDVRPWGPQDRLPPDIVTGWQEDLREHPEELHRIEIELWYRNSPDKRASASETLRTELENAGGAVLDEREIAPIYYHAILAELPAESIRDLIDDPSDGLSAVDEVMFLRPQTLCRTLPTEDDSVAGELPGEEGDAAAEPIVALFDGLPLAAHQAIAGRLRLDDPEDLAASYGRAIEQQHGTAMASIILNGDAHRPTPVRHQLYVRPVTVPDGNEERFPRDRLAVHVLYEALLRLLEGECVDGEQVVPAAAPKVRIVNLSLADAKRRFAGIVSPWARLLDHLAFKHRLLFIVSAGNILDAFEIDGIASFIELEDAAPERRTEFVLASLLARKAHRALLSPAETINGVSVGARHDDSLEPGPAAGIDPYHLSDLPNVSSALGTGANRSAKPDLLMAGGRERLAMVSSRDPVRVRPVGRPGRQFGIGAATPGVRGELDRITNVSGTSPAAALTTNAALRIEAALRTTSDLAIPEEYLAVVLKALLAHGAAWEADVAAQLEGQATAAGHEHWTHKRLEVSRFLGFGAPDINRLLGNSLQRALVLGYGELTKGKAATYPVPLPRDLSGKNEWRAMTATLAWLTPIHCRHGAYRHATLDLNLNGIGQGALGASKLSEQPGDDFGGRGTIIHRRWAGRDPAVFFDDQGFELKVGCRSATDGLEDPVPYAIAVTLEVGAESQIDIFTEINDRVRSGTPIIVRAEAGGE